MKIGICYIAYSRIDKCKKALEAVLKYSSKSDYKIYVFSDYPHNVNKNDNVMEVRNYLKRCEKKNHGRMVVFYNKFNLGSFNNIRGGMEKVLEENDAVILIEEDVLINNGFLNYMEGALHYYEKNKKIFAISGYNSMPFKIANIKHDSFCTERFCCYGLGIWKDRFESINWNLNELELSKINKKKFNKIAKDLSACFEDDLKGKRFFQTSWDIIMFYNMLLQERYEIVPKISYCNNIGFDGSGEFNVAGTFKNYNYREDYAPQIYNYGEELLNRKDQTKYIRYFIQDSPKKWILRNGRRMASLLHIEKFANKLKGVLK